MGKTLEQKGNFVDPLDWANKNISKLKTVRYGNTNVTPRMMIRDRKVGVLKNIIESQKKNLYLELSYKDYVLLHKICYSKKISPTEFIQKLVALFEVEDDKFMQLLELFETKDDEFDSQMPLTETELYDMIEKSRNRSDNGKSK